jgi:hypothetical protein
MTGVRFLARTASSLCRRVQIDFGNLLVSYRTGTKGAVAWAWSYHSLPFPVEFTDKVQRNCHFQTPGWNCMTDHQALVFPMHVTYRSVSNKISLSVLRLLVPGSENLQLLSNLSVDCVEVQLNYSARLHGMAVTLPLTSEDSP